MVKLINQSTAGSARSAYLVNILIRITCLGLLLLPAFSPLVKAADFDFKVAMSQAESGNYYIKGQLENEEELDFLVDTGSGLVILSEAVFYRLTKKHKRQVVDRKAARMADGRTKAINIYRFDQLVLSQDCSIGPIELAVIPGGTRNILGLSALNKVAPFAIYTSPPALAVSGCSSNIIAQTQPLPALTQR